MTGSPFGPVSFSPGPSGAPGARDSSQDKGGSVSASEALESAEAPRLM